MAQEIQKAAPSESAASPPVATGMPVRKGVSLKSAALRPKARTMAGEDRLRLIAEAAYYRAEQRGFAPGRELEDWLAAEIEIDALIADEDG